MAPLRTALILAALAASALGCAPSQQRQEEKKRDVEEHPAIMESTNPDSSSTDDTPDETEDDVSKDEEDFDLICDSHLRPNRSRRLPDAVIIGAKKGGTRALIEFLKLHPRLKAAGPEIHFFDKHFDLGVPWYESRMPEVTAEQLAMEKTPGYFHSPTAPKLLRQTLPEAKLLLILRDPVKRLISDYNQFRSRNLDDGKTYPTLEELVFDKESGEIDAKYPPLQRSLYHRHMARWLEHFSLQQIHIVHGEKFIRRPWEELRRVEEFLGVEPVIAESNFFFNGTKGFYCGKDTRTTGVWECTKKKCLSKAKGRPKPPVEAETVRRLNAFYGEHNKRFYDLVGTDFGWPEEE